MQSQRSNRSDVRTKPTSPRDRARQDARKAAKQARRANRRAR